MICCDCLISQVVWQEAFESISTLPKTAVVEVWKDFATLSKAVAAGFDAILSRGWYLDKQSGLMLCIVTA